MEEKAIVQCEKCNRVLRVPADRGALRIRCPYCQTQFIWKPDISQQLKAGYVKMRNQRWPRWLKIAIMIGLLVGGFALTQFFEGSIGDKGPSPKPSLSPPSVKHESQWVRISYDDLVDKETITHSGQTIGVLLNKISKSKLLAVG
jgi:LSD1 subclass zinc finger protein